MAGFAFPSAQANNYCEGQTLKAWVPPNKSLKSWKRGKMELAGCLLSKNVKAFR
jgi:hypothetical protein